MATCPMAYPTPTAIATIGVVVHNGTRTNHHGRDCPSCGTLRTH